MLKSTLLGFFSGFLLFIVFISVIMYYANKKVSKIVANIDEEAKTAEFIEVLPENTVIYLYSPITKRKDTLKFGSNKVFFINFWATWCRPCVEEMDDIQELYKKKKAAMDFYIISTEEPEVVANFLKKKKWALPVYTTTDSIPFLKHESIPRTYIIKNNVIYLSHLGKNNWNHQKVIDYLEGLEN